MGSVGVVAVVAMVGSAGAVGMTSTTELGGSFSRGSVFSTRTTLLQYRQNEVSAGNYA